MDFGTNLKEIRHKKGFTQEDVAEHCGITKMMISAIENDKREPSLRVAKAMSLFLGATLDELTK